MAQPHRLETPLSNRRYRSKVDVLAHAAQEACLLHIAAFINEDLDDHKPVEIG